ncbi:MAG: MFS transporter [Blautia sp.]|nr:MFS transporter [Blautia sp.]
MEKEKSKPVKRISRLEIIVFVILFVLASVPLSYAWTHRSLLVQKPTYILESTSELSFGPDGQTLVIDNGKKTLLLLNAEGNLIRRYDGGLSANPFYYVSYAAQASDGSIYVADITYGSRGNLLDQERIIHLNGSRSQVLFTIDYTQAATEDTPLQYGRIKDLQVYEDEIYFAIDNTDNVELKKLSRDGTLTDLAIVPADGSKTDLSYDIPSQTLTVISRTGSIRLFDVTGKEEPILVRNEGHIPFDVSVRNGQAYYTDLTDHSICHFSVEHPETVSVFYRSEDLLYRLAVSQDGQSIIATDYAGFYRFTGNDDYVCTDSEYFAEARVSFYSQVILVWILLIFGILMSLVFFGRLFYWVGVAVSTNENAMRILLIVIACVSIFCILSYMFLSRMLSANTVSREKQTRLFAEMLLENIDANALTRLDRSSDYSSEEYTAVKTPLDEKTREYYETGDYYYYIIYRALNGNISYIMDFEDTMPVAYPVYEDDPENNEYAQVMHTGEEILVSEISSYGSWCFLLAPIFDSQGNIIAELEVGQNLDELNKAQRDLTMELIVSTAVSTVVLTMLLLELTFLLGFFQSKLSWIYLDDVEIVPVRTLMFLSYLADSMQDAFIAILCSQLYQGGLPIPDGVAIALPLSAQLFMMAVFSFFAGSMTEDFGSKKSITLGMLVQFSGFLCCVIGANYPAILLGKMLIGSGMGIVYVSCNTVAASHTNSEKAAAAFAGISAGTLSGLTIGAGLSSVLLSLGGWRLIYIAGAVIIGVGMLLSLASGDVRPKQTAPESGEDHRAGLREFLFSRRVIGFFLLLLLPFMMALSYREYFFPLFAQEHGITEVRIGQIYLLCGIFVIYAGPYLSEWMLKTFGALWSVVISSAAMGLNMLLFVVHPNLVSVLIGVVILSVIISFAYTCQYTYFELTPESLAYGAGKSMGIYSVFESLGQTIGPIAFGSVLAFGYRTGIGIFCTVLLLMSAIFAFLMRKDTDIYRQKKEESSDQ